MRSRESSANLTNIPMRDSAGINLSSIERVNSDSPPNATTSTNGAKPASKINTGNIISNGLNDTNMIVTSVCSNDLLKHLTKSAKTYNMPRLKYSIDPRKRKDEFLDWVEKLKEVTYTQPSTSLCLEDFPPALPSNIDGTVN